MTEDAHSDPQDRPQTRRKLWLAVAAVALIATLVVAPPLVSINRYKSRITQLVSTALQRPVSLSSVELRILPQPGFVLTDLTVAEDPSYGAEPVLHANTVVVSIRIWSLWRGQLQISRISVDEASLNLVRTQDGRWNIDALFRTAAARPHPSRAAVPFPYMEATNSRVNVKNGVRKLPFSLVDADASLWRESAGEWRVRLRGQPARTDVSLDLADTGVVRAEVTLHPVARLEEMPLHLDLDWREAQLGQLSRLLIGSDEGWRGNLAGELHLDGTVDSAQVKSRLRAEGVHRAEFAPAAPLDFDATCSFVFHSADRSLQNLLCDSPVGDGRARLTGNLPGAGQSPDLALELDHIPAQAGLDMLRTVRSDLDPGLQAAGMVSGKLSYQKPASPLPADHPSRKSHPARAQAPASPLAGSFAVEGLSISGGALGKPVQIGKLLLEPAAEVANQPTALAVTVPISAGAPSPLVLTARMAMHGFQIGVHGSAALPRLRELAQAAGFPQVQALDQIAGEPALVDVTAEGPWLPSVLPAAGAGAMTGTVTLYEANWRADWLAGPVLLSSATLHMEDGAFRWDPIAFSFGPVKGTATLELAPPCDPPQECAPRLAVRFASLDVAALQAALLGVRDKGTLLSSLMARLRPASAQPWPRLQANLQADSFILGPFTLHKVDADLQIRPGGAEATSFQAETLGGEVRGTASLTPGGQPVYKLDGDFSHLNPAQTGQLLGMKWAGGVLDGNTSVQLSGYIPAELSSSAVGSLHFDWRHGVLTSLTGAPVPPALARFDRWEADASIAKGVLTLRQNTVARGARRSSVAGTVEFGVPARVRFSVDPQPSSKAAPR